MSDFTTLDAQGTVMGLVRSLEEADQVAFDALFNVEHTADEWRLIAGIAIKHLWDHIGFLNSDMRESVEACLKTALRVFDGNSVYDYGDVYNALTDEADGERRETLEEAMALEVNRQPVASDPEPDTGDLDYRRTFVLECRHKIQDIKKTLEMLGEEP